MRSLEILLAISTVLVIFFPYRKAPTFGRLIAIGLIVLMSLQIVIEGARWQMIPIYIVAIIWIACALLSLNMPNWLHKLTGGIGIILVIFGVGLALVLPIRQPPQPTGEYAVGTTVYHLRTGRPEIFSADPNDSRELMLQVWYPAEESDQPKADYIPNLSIGGPAIASIFDLPSFFLNHMSLIKPNAQLNAPIVSAEGGFPLLIFSHGRSGTRIQNTQLVEELVSHGYIIAAVDHSYGAGYTVFPDGRTIYYDRSIFGDDSPEQSGIVITEWVLDFQFIIDTFAAIEPDSDQLLANAINFDQIGAFGHSTGGGASYEFCFRDQRCKAALGLDPWLVPTSTDAVTQGLDRPAMVIKQDRPLSALSDARLNLLFAESSQATYYVTVSGTRHYDFTDFKHLSPALSWLGVTGPISDDQMATLQNQYTRAFFDHHLRSWQGALLFIESADFPEAQFHTIADNP